MVSPVTQGLVALRYITMGETLNVSKSATGNTVRHVSNLLCYLANQYIKLSHGAELVEVKYCR